MANLTTLMTASAGAAPLSAADFTPGQLPTAVNPTVVAAEDVDMASSDVDGSAASFVPAPARTLHLDPLFSAAENDVYICSSDGVKLGFPLSFLEPAARDWLFSVSVDDDSKLCVGLDLVAEELARFLLYLHPKAPDPSINTFPELRNLCRWADRYGFDAVARSVLSQHGLLFADSWGPDVFALAVRYRMPSLAVAALQCNFLACEASGTCVLNDMPWEAIKLLEPAVFYRLHLEHEVTDCNWERVLGDLLNDRTWFEVATAEKTIERLEVERFRCNKRLQKAALKAAKRNSMTNSAETSDGVTSTVPPASHAIAPSKCSSSEPENFVPKRANSIFCDPLNDLKVQSSSDSTRSFLCNRAFLAAQSNSLQWLVHSAEEPSKSGRTLGRKAIVRLDVPPKVLKWLLVFTHPQSQGRAITTVKGLEDFCLTAETFDLYPAIQRALNASGPSLLDSDAPTVLALALLFDLPALASLALLEFDNVETPWQPARWEVSDIPWRLAKRLPFPVLVRLLRCERDIRRQDCRCQGWKGVADELLRLGTRWVDEAEAWLENYGTIDHEYESDWENEVWTTDEDED